MAKNKQQQSQTNGNGGKSAGDVAKSIQSSEEGRRKKNRRAKQLERARNEERTNGTFHARVNNNRSNSLQDALSGVEGSYAFPGRNEPSILFRTESVVGKAGKMAVIYLETIQEGHKLAGAVFDPATYTPVFYIGKFGTMFASRLEGKLAAKTQELVCHYFATLDDVDQPTNEPEVVSENMTDLLSEKVGLYKLKTERGEVALRATLRGRTVHVNVESSTVPDIAPSTVSVPIYLLRRNAINQVTDDVTYAAQLTLFMFLRIELAELLNVERNNAAHIPVTDGKQVRKKEKVKFANRRDEETKRAQEIMGKATALHSMRKQAISATAAGSGAIGYVDMSNMSGELIVLFGKDGADHVAQVAFIGDKHVLRLAGVDVGTRVFGGQILVGHVDRHDYGVSYLTPDEVRAKNALIGYIRYYFTKHHVRFLTRKPAKPANLTIAA
jgi:hypothetical protein